MANIIKGDELMLFKDGKSLAFATSHSLTITGNTTDISSKDHGYWGASEIGNITWEITSENLYTDNDYNALFNSMLNKTSVTVAFGHAKNYSVNGLGNNANWTLDQTTNVYYVGKAYITSLTANANSGENATFSVTLTGHGALLKNGEVPETPVVPDTPSDTTTDYPSSGVYTIDYINSNYPSFLTGMTTATSDNVNNGSDGGDETLQTLSVEDGNVTAEFNGASEKFNLNNFDSEDFHRMIVVWDNYEYTTAPTNMGDNEGKFGWIIRSVEDSSTYEYKEPTLNTSGCAMLYGIPNDYSFSFTFGTRSSFTFESAFGVKFTNLRFKVLD